MYEALEHYKVYKQKQKVKQELDKLIHKLILKNGVTHIQYERFQYNKKQG